MIVTTSRRPSAKSRTLCKELQSVIPLSCYILRGKKGIRELLSLSVEKGADRTLIVTSKGNEVDSFLFYSEWKYLGELSISAALRRELDLPKVTPLHEDVPFLLQSSEREADTVAYLFGADMYDNDDACTFMTYTKGWIDFYRLDISEQFVGPRIKVNHIHENHH
ncbi:MAG: hypothetical protein AYK19_13275 [Theionarchaea archaeon DG-70-1]|nr:MAG: hypothetical protein AYK19_13275 [Theionarchaea archaeon DG-70-1]